MLRTASSTLPEAAGCWGACLGATPAAMASILVIWVLHILRTVFRNWAVAALASYRRFSSAWARSSMEPTVALTCFSASASILAARVRASLSI